MTWPTPPFDLIAAVLLLVLAAACFRASARAFASGFRDPDHPDQSARVIRGFRWGITALSLIAFAGGIGYHVGWPLILGAVFLGEELVETGIMLLALRSGPAAERA